MKDWIECGSCWAEFRVISDIDNVAAFCPFCGGDIEVVDEEEEEYQEDDDYDER